MKKLIYSVFILLGLSLLIAGCSGDSYEKRLKKEKKAIKNYIADNEIKVIYDGFPKDYVFDKNAFYFDNATGVYIRVIEPGKVADSLTIKDEGLEVFIRFDSVTYLVEGKTYMGNNYNGIEPMIFRYNIPGTYMQSNYNTDQIGFSYMSPACVLPMKKGLGYGAIVDLIVPFINGSAYQKSKYEPFKFTRMKYTYNRQD